MHLQNKQNNQILDIGCGNGLLAIASEPFLGGNGKYTGIDVLQSDIRFCKKHFPSRGYEFIHFDVKNPAYANSQKNVQKKWPFEDNTYDLLTALSVWTHLNEEDSLFYMKEVSRVLKTGGKAIITFFLLDENYEKSLEKDQTMK